MPRRTILSGSTFEAEIGYARAVVDGPWIFVSGCTGFDYLSMTLPDAVVAQCEGALRNLEEALRQADATMSDVVRVRYLLPNRVDFPLCWPSLRRCFGGMRPAATMMEVGLIEARVLFEIEATARRQV